MIVKKGLGLDPPSPAIDLYVLRRAAEVYQGLMDRFVPKQRTDYVALLNEWAVGFYTELPPGAVGKSSFFLPHDVLHLRGQGQILPSVANFSLGFFWLPQSTTNQKPRGCRGNSDLLA